VKVNYVLREANSYLDYVAKRDMQEKGPHEVVSETNKIDSQLLKYLPVFVCLL